jgi:hypothetical protein
VRNVSSVIMRGNALKWRRIRQFGANKAIKTGIGVEVDKDALDEFWPVLENNLHRYGYHLSGNAIKLMLQQFPIGMAAYALTLKGHGPTYWILGILLIVISSVLSWHALKKRTR